MVASIGLRIGQWLYQKGKIKEDQIDLIRYAVEICCSEFIEIFIILLYSIVTKQILQTLLYLFFFQSLRQMFKGYHAKTILRCFILTIGAYLIILSVYTHIPMVVLIVLWLISMILQIDCCMREKQFTSICISLILHSIVCCISYVSQDIQILNLLVLVDFVVSISLIPERSVGPSNHSFNHISEESDIFIGVREETKSKSNGSGGQREIGIPH